MALGPVSVAQDDGGRRRCAAADSVGDHDRRRRAFEGSGHVRFEPGHHPRGDCGTIAGAGQTATDIKATADEWIVSVRDVTATYVAAEGETAAAADPSALDVLSPEPKIESSRGVIGEPAAPFVGPVFSAGDVNVNPATLVKPKLPSRPRDMATQTILPSWRSSSTRKAPLTARG